MKTTKSQSNGTRTEVLNLYADTQVGDVISFDGRHFVISTMEYKGSGNFKVDLDPVVEKSGRHEAEIGNGMESHIVGTMEEFFYVFREELHIEPTPMEIATAAQYLPKN